MDDFRLDVFPDGVLIADLVAGIGSVEITLVGVARYEISVVCDAGRQLTLSVWTTERGKIDTQLRDIGEWAATQIGDDGNLKTLSASACSIHFEHMDRGHYWMGLHHSSGETMHINFSTSGYLKSKVLKHVEPKTAN